MHDHRHEESARDFLLRKMWADLDAGVFLIDPRTGKPFLPPTTETRHYPHGAGSQT